ncbi:MAG TPA: HRDC domain-containing protein, partial [Accumulibacter sp.]|nr:HRDC domain-containing protein [Accumulibacter sp.]
TADARPILKGEVTMSLRRASRSGKRPARQPPSDKPASRRLDSDTPLLAKLRLWRSQKAQSQGVPAYVILHDRTLAEIADARPDSLPALLDIAGIGTVKAQRYGDELLAIVADG